MARLQISALFRFGHFGGAINDTPLLVAIIAGIPPEYCIPAINEAFLRLIPSEELHRFQVDRLKMIFILVSH